MAINISGVHFSERALPTFIVDALLERKLSIESVVIELTESAMLLDIGQESNSVQRFSEKGICLSIDDFGTGFSSLAYLHMIPASIVKIDRSFTSRIEEDSSLLSSIHQLITSQGFETLVEGVETKAQSERLKQLGIFLQQGFGLGRPKPLSHYLEIA